MSGNQSNEFSRASQIKIGDQTFAIDEPKTIYVLEDGTISLTAAAERVSADSFRLTVEDTPKGDQSTVTKRFVIEVGLPEGKRLHVGLSDSIDRLVETNYEDAVWSNGFNQSRNRKRRQRRGFHERLRCWRCQGQNKV